MSNARAPLLDIIDALLHSLGRWPRLKPPIETLDQALRIAVREHQALQEALAHATITERRETDRLDLLNADTEALEGRAILAIQGGRQDLAQRAAESLVTLEAQRVAQSAVCAETRTTVRTLRQRIDADRIRLQKLNHGRALAKIRAIAPPYSHETRLPMPKTSLRPSTRWML
jgi:phage shock protein A